MRIKITKSFIFFNILGFALALIYYMAIEQKNYENLGFFSIIILVLSMLMIFSSRRYNLVSFPVLFSLLVWILNFGFFVLYLFDLEELIIANDLIKYSRYDVLRAYSVGIFFYMALISGMCINPITKNRFQLKETNISHNLLSLCLVVFFICLVPYINYSIRGLLLESYSAVRRQNVSGFLSYIFLLLYAVSIILFYYAHKKKQFLIKFFLFSIYIVQFFTGQRFDSMCIELTFLLINVSSDNSGRTKMKIWKFVIICFIAIPIFYIIQMVGKYRFDFATMYPNIFSLDNFIFYIKTNPVFSIFGEFGGTITSLISAVKNFSITNYYYGLTYLVAIIHILPSIHNYFPIELHTYVKAFPANESNGLGGSFLGEAYVNYGVFGGVVIFLIGIGISYLNTLERKSKGRNQLFDCWIYILYLQLFNIVRGYVKNIVFLPFWFLIIIVIYVQSRSKNVIIKLW